MPELEELQREMGDRVAVLGVQTNGTLERGAALFAQLGATFPSIREPGLVQRLEVRGVPFTVLVRPDGSMVKGVVGGRSKEWFKEQVRELAAR